VSDQRKKKAQLEHPQPLPASSGLKVIRLQPSISDYATFVKTTSAVLGETGPAAQKTKPNMLVLSLVNLASSET